MKKIELRKVMSAVELLQAIIASEGVDEDYCIYVKGDADEISGDTRCALDVCPSIVSDVEQVSEFVRLNDLELFSYGPQFNDVLRNVLNQPGNCSVEDLIRALNYYQDNDDFLDF
ncbi:DUF7716 domain-containing protein [Pseudomonas eucalypticola]|uniref:DUF7716 domain-containing protein n=1 Tax=Pseudomonas eucalypticola TaxID=2599595 RepID=A0A7D5D490_9PSED|nr:hypothetical protein [Pseudomonas eucalypticola]QKZ02413.1 hypothetical protein HWQ56_00845 [Pseudomonas eucalypticola]